MIFESKEISTFNNTSYDKIEIGKRLREFAKIKGSQVELAKQLGISPASLTDYFNGKTAPGEKMLHKLNAIGCYLPWLEFGISRHTNDTNLLLCPHCSKPIKITIEKE